MKVAIMQPYYLPYIGYFQLINAVDMFVIYDDVQYIKGGWINRNNIIINNEKFMFNLLLNGASSNKLINEITINPNQTKFLKTLKNAYGRTVNYNLIYPIICRLFQINEINLSKFIGNNIREICDYLNIQTKIIYSSELYKDNNLKSQDKVIQICNILKADKYINSLGGQSLYDCKEFEENGLELLFLKPNIQSYKQFNNEFIPNLSIIDVLMFNSVDQISYMLHQYELI